MSTAAATRLDKLTQTECRVLALIAAGRSNHGVAKELDVSERTIESHIGAILTKLELTAQPELHRRVLAVRLWLETKDHAATPAQTRVR